MDCISYMDIKFIWGNSNFQFVASDSVGNSGGILCVWEQSVFKKDGVSVSDNFIALYGTWLPNNTKILIVVIYAPQSIALKRTLWEYISVLINRWNGETLVLGDFNEVRFKEERFGLIFNQSNARAFNQFIASSGRLEVKMEGYSFTCSHPSASKISKLDRFLVSDGIFSAFPAITAGFDSIVEQAWHFFPHNDSNRLIIFKKKLQNLKKIIRVWVRDLNNLKAGVKNSIIDNLVAIDKDLDNGIISDDMLLNRLEFSQKLYDLKQSDLKDAAQKAKVKWAIEGDENSKFFHGIINKRRAQLAIRGVFVNGVWHTEPSLVKDSFLDHFATHFKQPASPRLKLNMSLPNCLSSDQTDDLDRNITNDEIRAAVWECVTKILANRLSMVISDLVSNTQSAFVKNRQILDGPFILNEALAWCKRKKKQALIFKVDFAKAYDSVRWDFLLDVLRAFGFGSRWYTWIRGIFSSNMASILVNGIPTVEFLIFCGLKQGDPLAPFLFILVMETLHIFVSRAVNDGVFKGLQIHDSMVLSYLFYADDVVFLGECSDDNLANLIRILQCFQLASGLRINVQKSQVLGVGVSLDIVNQGASIIGCSIMHAPFKYLGVTKVKTLSIGGRLTLLKSVLEAVPLYTLSIYKAPTGFDFLSHCKIRVGNGLNTRFWLDTWIMDLPLSIRFPRIYALERIKEVSVAAKWGASSFDESFRRQVRDGVESQQWFELLSLLSTFISSPSSDRWIYDLNGDGMFRVKDIRSYLDDLFLHSSNEATRAQGNMGCWDKYIGTVPVYWGVREYRVKGVSFLARMVVMGQLGFRVYIRMAPVVLRILDPSLVF
nr:RNA-directed DNA polymerase, eukaryota [Tanacetum cinerariifolium]